MERIYFAKSPSAVCLWVLAGMIFGLAGCGEELMPTPNVYVNAEVDPFKDVPLALQGGKMDIFYITDRTPTTSGDQPVKYGSGRSRSVAYGSCIVEIGKDIPWDQVVKESRTQKRSQRLPVTVRSTQEEGRFCAIPIPVIRQGGKVVDDPAFLAKQRAQAELFYKELSRRLALTPKKEVFIFVHGFNNTFEEATTVTAEMWHFLGRQGVPIAYTWPAGAGTSLGGYTEDYESSRFTTVHLKGLLGALARFPEVEKINILAHSRGTDVASTALREMIIASLAAKEDPLKTLKIGHVVLAAPDIDHKVASVQLTSDRTFEGIGHTTIYVSSHDKAIGLSQWIFGGLLRIGDLTVDDLTEVQKKNMGVRRNVNVVDAQISPIGAGHSYYRSSPAVSSDIIQVIRYDYRPETQNERPLTELIPGFWSLDDDYLLNRTPAAKKSSK